MTTTKSKAISITTLIPEIQQVLRGYLREMEVTNDVRMQIESRQAEVKANIMSLLEKLELTGVTVEDEEVGMSVRVSSRTTNHLSKEKLLKLGVSAEVIMQATEERVSEPFVTVAAIRRRT